MSPTEGGGQGAEEREVQEGPCRFLDPPVMEEDELSEGQHTRREKPPTHAPCVGEEN